jgi:hypothetical protein
VLADQDVDVVRHDRAGPRGEFLPGDDIGEPLGDEGAGRLIELQERVLEEQGGLLVEGPNLTAGGLDLLAAFVEFSEFG